MNSMMGSASSQPADDTRVADAQARHDIDATQDTNGTMHDEGEVSGNMDNTPEQSKKRGAKKLKTYSGKKRLSSGKPKRTIDVDNEEMTQHAPIAPVARMVSPELGEEPSSMQSAAVDVSQQSPVINGHTDATNDTPDAEGVASKQSKLRKRKSLVAHNHKILTELRNTPSTQTKPKKAKKARRSKDVAAGEDEQPTEEPATQEANEEGLPTPTRSKQISKNAKVSSWLSQEAAENQQDASTSDPRANGAEPASHAYATALHQAEDAQETAEPEVLEAQEAQEVQEDRDQDLDDERRAYEVPSDSDDVYEPEEAQPTVKKTKSSKPVSKEKSKRKRDSTDNVDPPIPAKKRKKKSEATATPRSAAAPRQISTSRDFPGSGPFTPTEVTLVEDAVTHARKEHGFTNPQMIHAIQTSAPEVRALLNTLVNDVLPNRKRKAIQRFCRRHFNDAERGKWTEEQDEMLYAAHAEAPQKWVWIGERVGRLAEDCRDRWRNFLSLRDSRHTDVWTRDEELALAKAIAESVSVMTERLGRPLTPEEEDQYISWPVIIQKMGGRRNRLQCTNKWKKIRARNAKEKIERTKLPGAVDETQETKASKETNKKRFATMKIGDTYTMMKEIEYGNYIGRIDDFAVFWAVVTKMHPTSPYTTQDRRFAYNKLLLNIEKTDDFAQNVQAIMRFLEEHFGDQLDMRRWDEDPDKPARVKSKNAAKAGKQITKAYRSEERVQESDEDEEDVTQDVDMTGVTNDDEEEEVVDAEAGAEDVGVSGEEEEDDDEELLEQEEDEEEIQEQDEEEAVNDSEDERTPVPARPTKAITKKPTTVPDSPHISESDYSTRE